MEAEQDLSPVLFGDSQSIPCCSISSRCSPCSVWGSREGTPQNRNSLLDDPSHKGFLQQLHWGRRDGSSCWEIWFGPREEEEEHHWVQGMGTGNVLGQGSSLTPSLQICWCYSNCFQHSVRGILEEPARGKAGKEGKDAILGRIEQNSVGKEG